MLAPGASIRVTTRPLVLASASPARLRLLRFQFLHQLLLLRHRHVAETEVGGTAALAGDVACGFAHAAIIAPGRLIEINTGGPGLVTMEASTWSRPCRITSPAPSPCPC